MEKNKLHVNWDNRAQLLFGTADTSVMGRKHPMEQVYLGGAADFQERVLQMLRENMAAHMRNTEIYDYSDRITSEYEDLISIVENLKPE